ncbi:MAG: hypothetical protein ABRQ26_03010 [Syntrophomonadaceae bacterium]
MEEQLKLIESQLYKSELTFPWLKERLLTYGEIRAWYRFYREANQWAKKFFKEEYYFLMTDVILWVKIADDGQLGIHTYPLDEIAKSFRSYGFADKKSKDALVISELTVSFTAMKEKQVRDELVLKRPIPEENGDVEGFEKLVHLLEI